MQHNFRELNIWKDAMEIVRLTYNLSKELPGDERYGLISQINRSSVSIPSNIAEGTGRSSEKELIYFLNISISSSYELETQLLLVQDLFQVDSKFVIAKLNVLQKMINGFKRTISTQYLK